jgi:hypothetical protein
MVVKEEERVEVDLVFEDLDFLLYALVVVAAAAGGGVLVLS